MKENKAVSVTKKEIKLINLIKDYPPVFANKTYNNEFGECARQAVDVGIQYSKRDNRAHFRHHEARYLYAAPRHIYTCHKSRSFTDVGIGCIKALPKKKVRRVYLPETDNRGVGSTDVSLPLETYFGCKENGYYDKKKTSSKCIGGVIDRPEFCVNAQVSPINHTKSATTSPKEILPLKITEFGMNTIEKKFATTPTQMEPKDIVEFDTKPIVNIVRPVKEVIEGNFFYTEKHGVKVEKSFSSVSLVQRVHNLENPSDFIENKDNDSIKLTVKTVPSKRDKTSNRPTKMYVCNLTDQTDRHSTKNKENTDDTINNLRSTSVFRRRFQALRKSLSKKDDKIHDTKSSHTNPSHRNDAAVSSDPPSLVGRSYSNTNRTHSSKASSCNKDRLRKDSEWYRTSVVDSEFGQGVMGMFKLWGKKYNLDEDDDKNEASKFYEKKERKDLITFNYTPDLPQREKKSGRKFFFFKRKNKEKKPTKVKDYKTKRGVTTGRCEVTDKYGHCENSTTSSIVTKFEDTSISSKPPVSDQSKSLENYADILQRKWIRKYLEFTPVESRKSVKIRWNNNTYATSSSTILELMETVYKGTEINLQSRSDTMTDETSAYRSYTNQKQNFVQNFEAWMMPKTIPDRSIVLKYNRLLCPLFITKEQTKSEDNINVVTVDQLSSKGSKKGHKIKVQQHSHNLIDVNSRHTSSDYLKIDIPKGFLSETSNYAEDSPLPAQTSDEEVYNLMYDNDLKTVSTQKESKPDTKEEKSTVEVDDVIKFTFSVEGNLLPFIPSVNIREPETRTKLNKDIILKSKVCDVVGVGIITHRDTMETPKPILEMIEYDTDDSDLSRRIPKKNERAELYLQELRDYYRHWTDHDAIGMFSECVSDSHLQCCSDSDSKPELYEMGDGTKSCSNLYEDPYGESTDYSKISSDESTKLMRLRPAAGTFPNQSFTQLPQFLNEPVPKMSSKALKKLRRRKDQLICRVVPKDSVEVSKKRKEYSTNRSKWIENDTASFLEYSGHTLRSSVSGKRQTRASKKVALPTPKPDETVTNSFVRTQIVSCDDVRTDAPGGMYIEDDYQSGHSKPPVYVNKVTPANIQKENKEVTFKPEDDTSYSHALYDYIKSSASKVLDVVKSSSLKFIIETGCKAQTAEEFGKFDQGKAMSDCITPLKNNQSTVCTQRESIAKNQLVNVSVSCSIYNQTQTEYLDSLLSNSTDSQEDIPSPRIRSRAVQKGEPTFGKKSLDTDDKTICKVFQKRSVLTQQYSSDLSNTKLSNSHLASISIQQRLSSSNQRIPSSSEKVIEPTSRKLARAFKKEQTSKQTSKMVSKTSCISTQGSKWFSNFDTGPDHRIHLPIVQASTASCPIAPTASVSTRKSVNILKSKSANHDTGLGKVSKSSLKNILQIFYKYSVPCSCKQLTCEMGPDDDIEYPIPELMEDWDPTDYMPPPAPLKPEESELKGKKHKKDKKKSVKKTKSEKKRADKSDTKKAKEAGKKKEKTKKPDKSDKDTKKPDKDTKKSDKETKKPDKDTKKSGKDTKKPDKDTKKSDKDPKKSGKDTKKSTKSDTKKPSDKSLDVSEKGSSGSKTKKSKTTKKSNKSAQKPDSSGDQPDSIATKVEDSPSTGEAIPLEEPPSEPPSPNGMKDSSGSEEEEDKLSQKLPSPLSSEKDLADKKTHKARIHLKHKTPKDLPTGHKISKPDTSDQPIIDARSRQILKKVAEIGFKSRKTDSMKMVDTGKADSAPSDTKIGAQIIKKAKQGIVKLNKSSPKSDSTKPVSIKSDSLVETNADSAAIKATGKKLKKFKALPDAVSKLKSSSIELIESVATASKKAKKGRIKSSSDSSLVSVIKSVSPASKKTKKGDESGGDHKKSPKEKFRAGKSTKSIPPIDKTKSDSVSPAKAIKGLIKSSLLHSKSDSAASKKTKKANEINKDHKISPVVPIESDSTVDQTKLDSENIIKIGKKGKEIREDHNKAPNVHLKAPVDVESDLTSLRKSDDDLSLVLSKSDDNTSGALSRSDDDLSTALSSSDDNLSIALSKSDEDLIALNTSDIDLSEALSKSAVDRSKKAKEIQEIGKDGDKSHSNAHKFSGPTEIDLSDTAMSKSASPKKAATKSKKEKKAKKVKKKKIPLSQCKPVYIEKPKKTKKGKKKKAAETTKPVQKETDSKSDLTVSSPTETDAHSKNKAASQRFIPIVAEPDVTTSSPSAATEKQFIETESKSSKSDVTEPDSARTKKAKTKEKTTKTKPKKATETESGTKNSAKYEPSSLDKPDSFIDLTTSQSADPKKAKETEKGTKKSLKSDAVEPSSLDKPDSTVESTKSDSARTKKAKTKEKTTKTKPKKATETETVTKKSSKSEPSSLDKLDSSIDLTTSQSADPKQAKETEKGTKKSLKSDAVEPSSLDKPDSTVESTKPDSAHTKKAKTKEKTTKTKPKKATGTKKSAKSEPPSLDKPDSPVGLTDSDDAKKATEAATIQDKKIPDQKGDAIKTGDSESPDTSVSSKTSKESKNKESKKIKKSFKKKADLATSDTSIDSTASSESRKKNKKDKGTESKAKKDKSTESKAKKDKSKEKKAKKDKSKESKKPSKEKSAKLDETDCECKESDLSELSSARKKAKKDKSTESKKAKKDASTESKKETTKPVQKETDSKSDLTVSSPTETDADSKNKAASQRFIPIVAEPDVTTSSPSTATEKQFIETESKSPKSDVTEPDSARTKKAKTIEKTTKTKSEPPSLDKPDSPVGLTDSDDAKKATETATIEDKKIPDQKGDAIKTADSESPDTSVSSKTSKESKKKESKKIKKSSKKKADLATSDTSIDSTASSASRKKTKKDKGTESKAKKDKSTESKAKKDKSKEKKAKKDKSKESKKPSKEKSAKLDETDCECKESDLSELSSARKKAKKDKSTESKKAKKDASKESKKAKSKEKKKKGKSQVTTPDLSSDVAKSDLTDSSKADEKGSKLAKSDSAKSKGKKKKGKSQVTPAPATFAEVKTPQSDSPDASRDLAKSDLTDTSKADETDKDSEPCPPGTILITSDSEKRIKATVVKDTPGVVPTKGHHHHTIAPEKDDSSISVKIDCGDSTLNLEISVTDRAKKTDDKKGTDTKEVSHTKEVSDTRVPKSETKEVKKSSKKKKSPLDSKKPEGLSACNLPAVKCRKSDHVGSPHSKPLKPLKWKRKRALAHSHSGGSVQSILFTDTSSSSLNFSNLPSRDITLAHSSSQLTTSSTSVKSDFSKNSCMCCKILLESLEETQFPVSQSKNSMQKSKSTASRFFNKFISRICQCTSKSFAALNPYPRSIAEPRRSIHRQSVWTQSSFVESGPQHFAAMVSESLINEQADEIQPKTDEHQDESPSNTVSDDNTVTTDEAQKSPESPSNAASDDSSLSTEGTKELPENPTNSEDSTLNSEDTKKPTESPPTVAKPPETKPIDTKPPDAKPPDTKPIDTKPPDTKPTDAKPPNAKPPDAKPHDTKPPDTKPPDTKPLDTKELVAAPPAKPADAKPPDTPPVTKHTQSKILNVEMETSSSETTSTFNAQVPPTQITYPKETVPVSPCPNTDGRTVCTHSPTCNPPINDPCYKKPTDKPKPVKEKPAKAPKPRKSAFCKTSPCTDIAKITKAIEANEKCLEKAEKRRQRMSRDLKKPWRPPTTCQSECDTPPCAPASPYVRRNQTPVSVAIDTRLPQSVGISTSPHRQTVAQMNSPSASMPIDKERNKKEVGKQGIVLGNGSTCKNPRCAWSCRGSYCSIKQINREVSVSSVNFGRLFSDDGDDCEYDVECEFEEDDRSRKDIGIYTGDEKVLKVDKGLNYKRVPIFEQGSVDYYKTFRGRQPPSCGLSGMGLNNTHNNLSGPHYGQSPCYAPNFTNNYPRNEQFLNSPNANELAYRQYGNFDVPYYPQPINYDQYINYEQPTRYAASIEQTTHKPYVSQHTNYGRPNREQAAELSKYPPSQKYANVQNYDQRFNYDPHQHPVYNAQKSFSTDRSTYDQIRTYDYDQFDNVPARQIWKNEKRKIVKPRYYLQTTQFGQAKYDSTVNYGTCKGNIYEYDRPNYDDIISIESLNDRNDTKNVEHYCANQLGYTGVRPQLCKNTPLGYGRCQNAQTDNFYGNICKTQIPVSCDDCVNTYEDLNKYYDAKMCSSINRIESFDERAFRLNCQDTSCSPSACDSPRRPILSRDSSKRTPPRSISLRRSSSRSRTPLRNPSQCNSPTEEIRRRQKQEVRRTSSTCNSPIWSPPRRGSPKRELKSTSSPMRSSLRNPKQEVLRTSTCNSPLMSPHRCSSPRKIIITSSTCDSPRSPQRCSSPTDVCVTSSDCNSPKKRSQESCSSPFKTCDDTSCDSRPKGWSAQHCSSPIKIRVTTSACNSPKRSPQRSCSPKKASSPQRYSSRGKKCYTSPCNLPPRSLQRSSSKTKKCKTSSACNSPKRSPQRSCSPKRSPQRSCSPKKVSSRSRRSPKRKQPKTECSKRCTQKPGVKEASKPKPKTTKGGFTMPCPEYVKPKVKDPCEPRLLTYKKCPPPKCPPVKQCPMTCSSRGRMAGIHLRQTPQGERTKTCGPSCSAWTKMGTKNICTSLIGLRTVFKATRTLSEEQLRSNDYDLLPIERPNYVTHYSSPELHNAFESEKLLTESEMMSLEKKKYQQQRDQVETSLANLFEINFNLRVTQGDKTTEITIENEDPNEKMVPKTSQDVYLVKDTAKCVEDNPKNDINIRIKIKSFKPNGEKKKLNATVVNDFSKQISKKFHTVTTRSEVTGTEDVVDNVYSMHRATIDLTESYSNKPNDEMENREVLICSEYLSSRLSVERNKDAQPIKKQTIRIPDSEDILLRSLTSYDKSPESNLQELMRKESEKTEKIKAVFSVRSSTVKENSIEFYDLDSILKEDNDLKSAPDKFENLFKSETHSTVTDSDEADRSAAIKTSTEVTDLEIKTSEENKTSENDEPVAKDELDLKSSAVSISDSMQALKQCLGEIQDISMNDNKEIMKAVFDNTTYLRQPKTKNRIRKIKDVLRTILKSDSSEPEDIKVLGNDLMKDFTYDSLQPNFFKNSDSLNNFMKLSEKPSIVQEKFNTKVASLDSGADSEWSLDGGEPKCICSTVAKGLKGLEQENADSLACCCLRLAKADQKTSCAMITSSESSSIECADVEIQNRFLSSKIVINQSVEIATPPSNFFAMNTPIVCSAQAQAVTISNTSIQDKMIHEMMIERKMFTPHSNILQDFCVQSISQSPRLSIPRDNNLENKAVVANGSEKEKKEKRLNFQQPADVLQLYETKKAVLEIYTEKTVTQDGEHLVAKLPKFVHEKENELKNSSKSEYKSYRSLCETNIFMMSITR